MNLLWFLHRVLGQPVRIRISGGFFLSGVSAAAADLPENQYFHVAPSLPTENPQLCTTVVY